MAYCVSGNYTISGCLGVGIDPAAYRLDLYTTAQSDGIRITSTNSKPMLRFYSTYNDASNRNWEMSPNGQVFGDFEIAQSAAKDGDAAGGDRNVRFYIKNNGNIGIGNLDPTMILSIKGGKCGDVNEGQGQLLIDGDVAYNAANGTTLCQSGAGSVIVFRGKYDSAANYTGFAGIAGSKENTTDGNYGGNLRFYTRTHGVNNPKEWMRITNTGNIGIGTAAPTSKLDVCGADGKIQSRVDSSDGSTINVRPNAGKCGWISYTEDAVADRWGIGVKNGDAKLYFSSGNVGIGGGTTRMIIDGGGCVGINTTSPTYRLHVNGTFYAAGSSQDYKQSICNYNTDSCMFMKLKPVTYQYKEEYCHLGKELKSGTQIGLIAEEVAETYPELAILVNEEDNKVVRNVDYEKLSVILLSEVQKLRREVDDLKHKQ
jgi:hypothetical protein